MSLASPISPSRLPMPGAWDAGERVLVDSQEIFIGVGGEDLDAQQLVLHNKARSVATPISPSVLPFPADTDPSLTSPFTASDAPADVATTPSPSQATAMSPSALPLPMDAPQVETVLPFTRPTTWPAVRPTLPIATEGDDFLRARTAQLTSLVYATEVARQQNLHASGGLGPGMCGDPEVDAWRSRIAQLSQPIVSPVRDPNVALPEPDSGVAYTMLEPIYMQTLRVQGGVPPIGGAALTASSPPHALHERALRRGARPPQPEPSEEEQQRAKWAWYYGSRDAVGFGRGPGIEEEQARYRQYFSRHHLDVFNDDRLEYADGKQRPRPAEGL